MMKAVCLAAIAGCAQAFAPGSQVAGFGRGANQLAVCRATPAHKAAASMTMIAGPGSRKGGSTPRSSIKVNVRNFFVGNNKSNSGGLNGNNGSGGNKGPPAGPLSASGAADDGKKKAEETGKGLWSKYNANLEKRPIITKALTSAIGFALGDYLAQKFIDKRESLDLERLGRMASFGLLVHGPTGHFFYNWLDKTIPGTEALAVASKVFVDQVIWNPIFGTMFFGYMGAAEGLGGTGIKNRISDNLWASVKGSWTVWPVAHAINFKFVPTSQRLLYINSIQIGYNMFLSVLAKRAGGGAAPSAHKASHKVEKAGKHARGEAKKAGNELQGQANKANRKVRQAL